MKLKKKKNEETANMNRYKNSFPKARNFSVFLEEKQKNLINHELILPRFIILIVNIDR